MAASFQSADICLLNGGVSGIVIPSFPKGSADCSVQCFRQGERISLALTDASIVERESRNVVHTHFYVIGDEAAVIIIGGYSVKACRFIVYRIYHHLFVF